VRILDDTNNAASLSHGAVLNANAWKVDTTNPTVTITRDDNSGTLNPVNSATIRFTLSEAHTGFDLSDVALGGSGGTWDATGLSSAKTDAQGRTYYTAVLKATTSPTTEAVTVTVNAARFKDTAGNDNSAATALSIAVNTQELPTPSGALSPDSDTGNGQTDTDTDNITKLVRPTFSGTAAGGSVIELTLQKTGGSTQNSATSRCAPMAPGTTPFPAQRRPWPQAAIPEASPPV
jgi:hypothetical protein